MKKILPFITALLLLFTFTAQAQSNKYVYCEIKPIGKFFKENCLVEQAYVQDGDMTVKSYTDSVAKALGGDIKIVAFTRYEKGEGVEKKRDDFAAEVASMVK